MTPTNPADTQDRAPEPARGTPSSGRIAIVLVDDHQIFLEGLKQLLQAERDFRVLATLNDGRKALDLVEEFTPDVVVMDLLMPGLPGIDVIEQIVASAPQIRVIALSSFADLQTVRKAFAVGAMGYILKESAYRELKEGIRTVLRGRRYLGSQFASALMEEDLGDREELHACRPKPLTPREREVLGLLAAGLNVKQIAWDLDLSHKTIEVHRANIMNKLQLTNLADLVKYAIRHGFLRG